MSTSNISVHFSENAIDVQEASTLPSIGCGGECVFIGRTRPELNPTHGELLALNYDCYQEMASQELHALAREARSRFAVNHIKVTHSIGKVAINEASVVIAVGSDHREEAFLASRFMINVLKQRVPIWKQEVWAEGLTWSDGKPL